MRWFKADFRKRRIHQSRRLGFESMEDRVMLDGAADDACGQEVCTPEEGNGGTGQGAVADPNAMPAFSLQDVNPASPRYQQGVSPRDYLEQVSAWYFGRAT